MHIGIRAAHGKCRHSRGTREMHIGIRAARTRRDAGRRGPRRPTRGGPERALPPPPRAPGAPGRRLRAHTRYAFVNAAHTGYAFANAAAHTRHVSNGRAIRETHTSNGCAIRDMHLPMRRKRDTHSTPNGCVHVQWTRMDIRIGPMGAHGDTHMPNGRAWGYAYVQWARMGIRIGPMGAHGDTHMPNGTAYGKCIGPIGPHTGNAQRRTRHDAVHGVRVLRVGHLNWTYAFHACARIIGKRMRQNGRGQSNTLSPNARACGKCIFPMGAHAGNAYVQRGAPYG